MSELAKALLAFQKDAPEIQRDALNPHFGNRFPSLEGLMGKVLPTANKCGLVVTQFPTTVENGGGPKPALRTRITHADTGEFLEDVMLLMPGKEDPQGQGSAITYARRYSLMAALGLVADEDDDGNAATRSGAVAPGNPAAPDDSSSLGQWEATTPTEPIKPSEVVLHWSKNKGKKLGELTAGQLRWYAEEWKMQDTPSEYDHLVKAAAVALNLGDDHPITPDLNLDIPF